MAPNDQPAPERKREFIWDNTAAPRPRRGRIAVILIGILLLAGLAVGGFLYYAQHQTTQKIKQEVARVKQGVYTPEQIQEFLAKTAKAGNEFDILKAMDVDASGDTLETRDSAGTTPPPRDVISLYREILDYNPDNLVIKDGLEKIYYLNIHRAEKAQRERKYYAAAHFYQQAEKIKPLAPAVREEMELTKKRADISSIEGEIPTRRSYESVYETVQSKLNLVRYLYDKEKKISPLLKGKMTVEFSIRPDGTVADARVLETSLDNPRFEDKLLAHIKLWEFDAVDARAGDMKMNYPFIFYGEE